MTQIHKHRQSDLNRRDGGGGGGGAAGITAGAGTGGAKTRGNRTGLIESNLIVSVAAIRSGRVFLLPSVFFGVDGLSACSCRPL